MAAMFHTLFKRYHDEILILTPTGRLAFFLRQQFAHAKIYPLNDWLLNYWQDNIDCGYLTPKLMLNDKQVQLLWQKITGSTITTAQRAQQAWQIAHHWEIELNDSLFHYHDDCKIWHQWANTLKALYKKNEWTDKTIFIHDCLQAWNKQLLTLPKEIWFVGFSQLKPYEKTLVETWQKRGVNCQLIHLGEQVEDCVRLGCRDTETEWRYFAQWAKHQDQNQTIGFIVPNLKQHQAEIRQALNDYFPNPASYHLSIGTPLNKYPLIQSALHALSLLQPEIAFHDLSHWLLSPYFTPHAQREAQLRETCAPYITTPFAHSKADATLKPQEWAAIFQTHLDTLGWIKNSVLSSEEQNLLTHWHNLLRQFAALSVIDYSFTLSEAIDQLRTLAEQIALPMTNSAAPIQIMGTLEAAGLIFDQLWISGWHHLAWPSQASANSFLPLALQQKAGVPHCGAEQELQFCQALTHELCQSAKHIIVSYPQQHQDQPLKASSLIQHLPEISWQALSIPQTPTFTEMFYTQKPAQLETYTDNRGPTLDQTISLHQGSAIFKEQAACPFRAFVRLRLGGKALPNLQTGFSALARGNMIHQILEKIWRQLGTQAVLKELSPEALGELVEKHIWTILKQTTQRHENLFEKQFFNLEQQRLQTLVLQWLHYEKERAPFIVIATEQKIETRFSELDLKLRIDRIDQLNDGSHMIIDYKTSECKTSTWFGDRPDEPQLPLYYVVSSIPIQQIAFAQLRADDVALKSHVIEPHEQQLWDKTLTQLAQEYLTGIADVRPKDGEQTCRFCDLSNVCRIGLILQ